MALRSPARPLTRRTVVAIGLLGSAGPVSSALLARRPDELVLWRGWVVWRSELAPDAASAAIALTSLA